MVVTEVEETGECLQSISSSSSSPPSADEYFNQGKDKFRAKEYEEAASCFSSALEAKIESLAHDEWSYDLAPFYLWYADALLCKEESSSDLFRFLNLKNGQSGGPFVSTSSQHEEEKNGEDGKEEEEEGKEEEGKEEEGKEEEGKEEDGKEEGKEEEEEEEGKEDGKEEEGKEEDEGNGSTSESENKSEDSSPQSILSKSTGDIKTDLLRNVALLEEVMKMNNLPQDEQNEKVTPSGQEKEGEENKEGEEEGDIGDEQLAFENFEMANLIYTKKLSEDPSNPPSGLIADLSFLHIRLGDIYLTNEKYEEAAKEYKEAIDLRETHAESGCALVCPLISYAQSLHFSGRAEEALKAFENALSHVIPYTQDENLEESDQKNYRETAEDIQIQISEIKTKLTKSEDNNITSSSEEHPTISRMPGSQADIPSILPKTLTSFDHPLLTDASQKVDLGVLTKEEEGESGERKKRRIDLSQLCK